MTEHLLLAEPIIDTPEVYVPSRERPIRQFNNGEELLSYAEDFNDPQKAQLSQEAKLYDINPSTDPDKFVEARNNLMSEVEQVLNERLSDVKQLVVTKTAEYLYPDDPTAQENMKQLLTSRLAATDMKVVDNLANKWLQSGGFDGASRQIWIGSAEIPHHMNSAKDAEAFYEQICDEVVAHETIHGMLAAGRQQLPKREANMRNGLRLETYWHEPETNKVRGYRYALWVNEATIESLRQIATGTEDLRYGSELMVLQTLDELSPGLKDELILAAINGKGPGATFGKMEALLGPTCIDDIEELLNKYNFSQMEDFKEGVAQMLPKDLRERGREILDKKEAEIMTGRPYYEAWKDYYRKQAKNATR